VHDALSVYDGDDYARATHALCGAHIARELVAAGEADPGNPWPTAALDALFELNTAAHQARDRQQTVITAEILDPLLTRSVIHKWWRRNEVRQWLSAPMGICGQVRGSGLLPR
jgi:hypothetical protein